MKKYTNDVLVITLAIVFIIAICLTVWAVSGFIVMLAWNYFMAGIFGFPEIGMLPATILVLAVSILLGAFRNSVHVSSKE